MKNNTGPLRTEETSTIIQARIEELSPRQLLLRDKLVRLGITPDVALKMAQKDTGAQNG